MEADSIFGNARKAAENADRVEYAIFPDEVVGSSGHLDQTRQRLGALRAVLLDHVRQLTNGYIWQKDAFNLRVVDAPDRVPGWKVEEDGHADGAYFDASVPPHLYGSTGFGDNIDDEWFIVFLLTSISRRFPNVSITVRDSDGDFLLIEAAYALPKWLEPDTSTNRVFIREGALHLIPPPDAAKKRRELPALSLMEALKVLRDPSVQTKAADRIQAAVERPLASYPEKARANQHRAHCLLPLPIAHILRHKPQLVSPAVEAFYDRDVDSMKAAAKMAFALPEGQQTPLVKTSVQFSRAMYAQLRQQEFQAPKAYPPLPPSLHPDYRSAELGMKLAVGFEMLYADKARYGQSGEEGEEEALQNRVPLPDDPGWQAFLGSLEIRGYFKGLLEGSAEHKRLIAAAAAEYRQTQAATRINTKQYSPVKRMEEILKQPLSVADFSESNLPTDDSDEWLFNGEAELTRAMRERESEIEAYEQGRAQRQMQDLLIDESPRDGPPGEAGFDTARVVNTMKKFVESMSSYEGAEVPGGGAEGPEVNLDMETFMSELEAALGIEPPGGIADEGGLDSDLDSDMDWDEEGGGDEDSGGNGAGVAGPSMRMKEAREESEGGESDSDDSFMEEYGEAMDQQLTSSTLPKSFIRPSEAGVSDSAAAAPAAPEPGPSTSSRVGAVREESSEEPLNVDVNLMKNLLDSYSAQQGLPGPASNLLGMLGISLPDDEKQTGSHTGLGKESSLRRDDDLEAPD